MEKDGLSLFKYLKQWALLKNSALFSSLQEGIMLNNPDLLSIISKEQLKSKAQIKYENLTEKL